MVMNAARFNERISFSFFLLLFCATGYIISKANIAKGYPKAGTTRVVPAKNCTIYATSTYKL